MCVFLGENAWFLGPNHRGDWGCMYLLGGWVGEARERESAYFSGKPQVFGLRRRVQ